ncbi:HAD-superfamily phosphatase, subfamily IIIA [Ascosphaera apis ARSEF 7405]|uniref:HAD-superfamily phosphatase, subfamily IIIA n=1 Tax=Ascosphaera apis ARSEF 7405 TaxID=392613 RepID=A0A167ZIW3_9EURO|nr:HAD-superfamily phosphatase, subfamily IIIA [Ascosphaera apis ARSEF 7405]
MAPSFNPNLSAFGVTITTLFRNPAMLMPHLVIPTFLHLPEDIGSHLLPPSSNGAKQPDIRALVLDKDNTLTPPEELGFPAPYLEKLAALRKSPTSPFNMERNPHGVLIVSNTVGSSPKYEAEAREIERLLSDLNIPIFRSFAPREGENENGKHAASQSNKKPLNHAAIVSYLKSKKAIESPSQIAVVGDRLATDVLMASLMGAWSVCVRDGVTMSCEGRQGMDYRGIFAKAEGLLERTLKSRGYGPVYPKN